MILRRDHVAGLAIAAAGGLVWLFSDDLPVGSMAMPGAGMMPKLLLGLMIALALAVVAVGHSSPRLAQVDWGDLRHALSVLAVAIPAVALYTWAGFVVTMTFLLFCLLFVVERRNVLAAAAFSVCVAVSAFVLFTTALKSPLPTGILGF